MDTAVKSKNDSIQTQSWLNLHKSETCLLNSQRTNAFRYIELVM